MKKRPAPLPRRTFLTASAIVLLSGCAISPAGRRSRKGKVTGGIELEKAIAELEAQDEKMMLVTRSEGRFVRMLAALRRPGRVLEVGTAHGYWTIWLASALDPQATLTTLEILPERAERARAHLTQVGLARRVTFLTGNAHELIPGLPGKFDFIFLNADKTGMTDYFQKVYPAKLAPGGVLLTHNAILRKDDMKDYLQTVAQHPDFDTVVLSVTMEDGFALSVHRTY